MKKVLKAVSILFGIIVAAVVAAAIIVPMVFDPNDYKDEIKSLVEKKTGRSWDLSGDIGLSIFPWLGFDLGPLTLGNAPGFAPDAFLKAEQTRVHVALLPLLRKEVQLDTVTMSGLVVNLTRDPGGKTNWDDLLAKAGGAKESKEAQPPAGIKEAQPPAGLPAFALGGIDLRDAEVTWDDRQKKERYAIHGLHLKTDAIQPGEPVDLELRFSLVATAPAVTGDIGLKGTVMPDLEARRYRLSPFEGDAKLKGEGVPGGDVEIALEAALDLDLAADAAKLDGFEIRALGIEAQGDVAATRISSATPALDGKLLLQAPKLSATLESLGRTAAAGMLAGLSLDTRFKGTTEALLLDPLALKITLAGGTLTTAPAPFDVSTRADIDLAKGTVALDRLSATGLGLQVSGGIRAEQVLATPRFNGTLKVGAFSPRDLMLELGMGPPVTADPKVLTRLSGDVSFTGSTSGVNLNPLALRLDDTAVQGSLGVPDLKKQALRFKLVADAMDLDRYLPPKPAGGPRSPGLVKAATPGAAAGAAAKLPVDMLRALDVQGSLGVGKLKASNLKLQDVVLNIDARDGNLRMSPLGAALYGGRYQGNVGLDVRGQEPRLSLDESLSGVQIEPLLTDLHGEAKLKGRADLEARLTASGADEDRMKKTLSGGGAFTVRDGAYKGVNLGLLARQGKVLLDAAKGKGTKSVEGSTQTDFSELSGTFKVDGGVIRNDDLAMKAPLLRLAGQGTADLGSERIDYTLNASLVETSKGQEGKDTEKLDGITVPIRVTGTFDEPQFVPDLTTVAKQRAQIEIDKQKKKLEGKIEEKIKKKLGDDVGGKIKDLLRF
ncbi:MAG: AsmA family protein [Gammaproteobacteria bacterium]